MKMQDLKYKNTFQNGSLKSGFNAAYEALRNSTSNKNVAFVLKRKKIKK